MNQSPASFFYIIYTCSNLFIHSDVFKSLRTPKGILSFKYGILWHALTQTHDKWSERQQDRMRLLFQMYPKLKELYDIVNKLRAIFRSKKLTRDEAKTKLHEWYQAVADCTIREIKSARDAIKSREENVLNYFIDRATNASAESYNSKLKAFRAQLRGIRDLPFFIFRICKVFG